MSRLYIIAGFTFELENLDSYMMKYRKYSLVSVLANKLDGVYVSADTE